jgi:hypothetical protein
MTSKVEFESGVPIQALFRNFPGPQRFRGSPAERFMTLHYAPPMLGAPGCLRGAAPSCCPSSPCHSGMASRSLAEKICCSIRWFYCKKATWVQQLAADDGIEAAGKEAAVLKGAAGTGCRAWGRKCEAATARSKIFSARMGVGVPDPPQGVTLLSCSRTSPPCCAQQVTKIGPICPSSVSALFLLSCKRMLSAQHGALLSLQAAACRCVAAGYQDLCNFN